MYWQTDTEFNYDKPRWLLIMIDEEETKIVSQTQFLTNLGPVSVEGLHAYIEKLELEIGRVRLEIKKKDIIKKNAELVFKHKL